MTPDDLRRARYRIGLSQDELAKVLGVTTNTVWRWEHGRVPYPEYLKYAMLWLLQEKMQRNKHRYDGTLIGEE